MARRKRKVYYWVHDASSYIQLWYGRGKWTREMVAPCSNVKVCHTLASAMRHCRKINALGGRGHIGRFSYRKGVRRYQEMWVHGYEPWK